MAAPALRGKAHSAMWRATNNTNDPTLKSEMTRIVSVASLEGARVSHVIRLCRSVQVEISLSAHRATDPRSHRSLTRMGDDRVVERYTRACRIFRRTVPKNDRPTTSSIAIPALAAFERSFSETTPGTVLSSSTPSVVPGVTKIGPSRLEQKSAPLDPCARCRSVHFAGATRRSRFCVASTYVIQGRHATCSHHPAETRAADLEASGCAGISFVHEEDFLSARSRP